MMLVHLKTFMPRIPVLCAAMAFLPDTARVTDGARSVRFSHLVRR